MISVRSLLLTILVILGFISIAPGLISDIKKQYKAALEPHSHLAIVKICGELNNIDNYVSELTSYFEDDNIKGILLELDCPGGAAGSSQALFNEINLLKTDHPKPVVAVTINMCASGAYYIASTANYIVATPAALVGSIGSFLGYFRVNERLNKWDIQFMEKHSGAYKTIINPFMPSTTENEALLQTLSDNVYEQFTHDVASQRHLSLSEVNQWANGKIFTGEQALMIKLVDELGCKTTAINKLRELALIKKEDKIVWIKSKDKEGLINKLIRNQVEPTDLADLAIQKLKSGFVWIN